MNSTSQILLVFHEFFPHVATWSSFGTMTPIFRLKPSNEVKNPLHTTTPWTMAKQSLYQAPQWVISYQQHTARAKRSSNIHSSIAKESTEGGDGVTEPTAIAKVIYHQLQVRCSCPSGTNLFGTKNAYSYLNSHYCIILYVSPNFIDRDKYILLLSHTATF